MNTSSHLSEIIRKYQRIIAYQIGKIYSKILTPIQTLNLFCCWLCFDSLCTVKIRLQYALMYDTQVDFRPQFEGKIKFRCILCTHTFMMQ